MYCKGVLEVEDFPVADISDHLERPDTIVWADFCAPSKEELHELADELGLHPLAVEDALDEHQRPKLDVYDECIFVVLKTLDYDEARAELITGEIMLFKQRDWDKELVKFEAKAYYGIPVVGNLNLFANISLHALGARWVANAPCTCSGVPAASAQG
jgi:hypothetical protein